MYLFNDYFTPAELTGYVRAALADLPINQFGLRQWLPSRLVPDLEYRYNKGTGGLIPAGQFRSYDAESPIAKRKGVERKSGSLPPLSEKIRLGEYDRLRIQANPDQNIRDQILADAVLLAKKLEARAEIARADALVNGSVTISENGVVANVDFGRAGGNQVVPGTLWSVTASADIVGDLSTWVQYYVDVNGEAPGAIVTSTRARGFMLRNAAIRAFAGNLAGNPTIVSSDVLASILSAHDLPPMYTYDAKYENASGAGTRFVPDTDVLLLPAPVGPDNWEGTQLGATFWGNTAESLEPNYGLSGDEPGIVVGNYKVENPLGLWTNAAAISLPVLSNPDLSMRARVLA